MNKTGRMIFVAGDENARSFAQKAIQKMDDEEIAPLILREGRMIFKSGVDGDETLQENGMEESDSLQEEVVNLQQPRRIRPQPNQTPANLAAEVYNQMLILGELYEDLISFNTQFTSQIQDMAGELDIIVFAMGRIYQTLARSNRLPRQNLRKPQIRDFCRGIVTTSNYLRGLLYDLRLLVRINQNSNIDNQLIVILLTLQAQQSQLFEIRQDCIEENLL